ncbi:transketolase [Spirochaetia bacterium]|nr:transketolase [Spirochaetia bacterium]
MNTDLREKQIATVTNLTAGGMNIIYLVSDSVSTSKIKPFMSRFPDRVINVGIAEQNLMGIAAGLANTGFIPFTGNAAPFLINRSAEQLKVDISYSNSNVKVNGLHAGFSYGADGITHHEVNDIAFIRGLPGFEIYVPCDGAECEQMTMYAANHKGPVYMSLNSGVFPEVSPGSGSFIPGKPLQFADGGDLTIIALGTTVHDALEAATALRGTCSPDIFALSSIRPLDSAPLIQSIKKTGKVLTVEQHSVNGGAGSIAAGLIAEQGLGAKLKRLGIPEGSFTQNRTAADNKACFKLDAAGIKETIREMLR